MVAAHEKSSRTGGKGGSHAGSKRKNEEPVNKRALKQQRQSHRPHAECVVAAKELWNKLRLKTNTKQHTAEMMKEMMNLMEGKFSKVALQHDASRVVQAALQFGDENQRKTVVKELCDGGNIFELAKSQYAHFVILKMIKYCSKYDDTVSMIVKSLKGNMNKLAVHAVGARVVELLFSTFPPKQTAKLKLEFYGPRFALFSDGNLSNKSSNPTIQTVLESQPNGKDAALESLLNIINKGIEKSLFSFSYYQQILCEYVTTATPNEVRALCSSLVDHSIHLLSTRAGSRVVAECAAYGTPKDRKRIMKSLKGYTRSSLLHSDAYIALLRTLDVVDDTVAVQKSVLAELQQLPEKKGVNPLEDDENDKEDDNESPLLELALSDTGSKLFLLLLAKDDEARTKYFDPLELEILRPNPTVKEGDEEVPTSKKSANTRRVELLQYMKSQIIDCCINHSKDLLSSRCGSKVLKEVYNAFPSKELGNSIVQSCDDDSDEGENLSVFEDSIGHLSIKGILNYDANREDKSGFVTKAMVEKYKDHLLDDIGSSNRGAFVLASLLKSDKTGAVRRELKNQMKDIKSRMKECKKNAKPYAGFEALLNDLK